MQIAVFGWYGHNNTGDERIKYCLDTYLKSIGITQVDFYDLHLHAIQGKTNKFDHYDLIIIGGGGVILSQCNYHDFINGIGTKLVTLGVSVERPTLTGNARKFAQALIHKSFAVVVRDKESAQKLMSLENSPKIQIAPDLTFLEPYQAIQKTEEKRIGINLLPKPNKFKYSTLSIPFFDTFVRRLGYLGFHNLVTMVDWKPVIQQLEQIYPLTPIPLYCEPQSPETPPHHQNDVLYMQTYFSHVPTQFEEASLNQCHIFLSMRLHGAIFAVQKGIPVISLSYLPKNRNFMQSVGLEEYVVDDNNSSEVLRKIQIIEKDHRNIRAKIVSSNEKMKQNITETIKRILEAML